MKEQFAKVWKKVRSYSGTALCSSIFLFQIQIAGAQVRTALESNDSDPRGLPELTLCTQNLENYGTIKSVRERVASATKELLDYKESKLLERFHSAHCDLIAVQELLGTNDDETKSTLEHLALLLQRRTGRFFEAKAGPSLEGSLHVGFLVARDRARILNSVSYGKVELPKLNEKERPRFFSRSPLEIQLEVFPQGEGIRRTITVVTFHLKSRAVGARDPSGLEWETYRMEEAEALRRIVENRHARSLASGELPLILLGDRNSNFDSATARILEGVVSLANFQEKGGCRLSKRGVPLCIGGAARPQKLFSILTLDPQTKNRPGTFALDGVYSWLDDIIAPSETLRFAGAAFDGSGDYDSGVIYEPRDASDHALVYAKLNW